MICLYNMLITTEAGTPNYAMIASTFPFISGSTRANTFAVFAAIAFTAFYNLIIF